MVVRIDEARDDGGAFGIPSGYTGPDQIADIGVGTDGEKASALDREGLGTGKAWVYRNDACVEDDKVGSRLRTKRAGNEARSGEGKPIAAGAVGHLASEGITTGEGSNKRPAFLVRKAGPKRNTRTCQTRKGPDRRLD